MENEYGKGLGRLAADNGIPLYDIKKLKAIIGEDTGDASGMFIKCGKRIGAFYNKAAPLWEKRLIVAHELAHGLFGHLDDGKPAGEHHELEARVFSCCLVALMVFDQYMKPQGKGGAAQ